MTTSLKRGSLVAALVGVLCLAGCVTIPEGPTYAALPGSRATFDQFQVDDAACRQFSTQAIGGMTPQQNANNAAVGSAVVGTAVGAAIGGLLGGGEGAAVGAGMGLFTGAAAGAGNSQAAGFSSQQRYDNAYYQCMFARGHRVPVPASAARSMRQASVGVPPSSAPAPYRGAAAERGVSAAEHSAAAGLRESHSGRAAAERRDPASEHAAASERGNTSPQRAAAARRCNAAAQRAAALPAALIA